MSTKEFNNLIKQMALKQTHSLEIFYVNYGKLIFSSAFLVCKNRTMCEDILSEILIKVWNIASTLEYIQHPTSWLYKITRNFSLNYIKKYNDYILDEDLNEPINMEKQIDDKIDFLNRISKLNDIEQQIITLRFVYKLKFHEISSILKMRIGSVTSLYFRAIKKLKKNI